MKKIKEIWAKYPHYVFIGGLALFVAIVFIATNASLHGGGQGDIPANKPAVRQQVQQDKTGVEPQNEVVPLVNGPIAVADLAQTPTPDLAGNLYTKGIWLNTRKWRVERGEGESSATVIFPTGKRFDKVKFFLGQPRPEKNLDEYVSCVNVEIYADEEMVWEKKIYKPITSDIPVEINIDNTSSLVVRLSTTRAISGWYKDVPGFILGDFEYVPKQEPQKEAK